MKPLHILLSAFACLSLSASCNSKAASAKARSKRPSLDLFEMGMQEGDVLFYAHNHNISVRVVSNRKVEYNGEITSLSAVATELLGYKNKCAPCPHWTFNGRSLSDIYDETYPIED